MYHFNNNELKLLDELQFLFSDQDRQLYRVEQWNAAPGDGNYHCITLIKLLLLAKLYHGEFPLLQHKKRYEQMALYEGIISYLIFFTNYARTPVTFNKNVFEKSLMCAIRYKCGDINMEENPASEKQAIRKTELNTLRSLLGIFRRDFNSMNQLSIFNMNVEPRRISSEIDLLDDIFNSIRFN